MDDLSESLINYSRINQCIVKNINQFLTKISSEQYGEIFGREKFDALLNYLEEVKGKCSTSKLTILVTGQSAVSRAALINGLISSGEVKGGDLPVPIRYSFSESSLIVKSAYVDLISGRTRNGEVIANLTTVNLDLDEDDDENFVMLEVGLPNRILELGMSIVDFPFTGEQLNEHIDVFAHFHPHFVFYLYQQSITVADSAYLRKLKNCLRKCSERSYRLVLLPICQNIEQFNCNTEIHSLEKRFVKIDDSRFLVPIQYDDERKERFKIINTARISLLIREVTEDLAATIVATIRRSFSPGNSVGDYDNLIKVPDDLVTASLNALRSENCDIDQLWLNFYGALKQSVLAANLKCGNHSVEQIFTDYFMENCKLEFYRLYKESHQIDFVTIKQFIDCYLSPVYNLFTETGNSHQMRRRRLELIKDKLNIWFKLKSCSILDWEEISLKIESDKVHITDEFNFQTIKYKTIELDNGHLFRVSIISKSIISQGKFDRERIRLYTYFYEHILYQNEEESVVYLVYRMEKHCHRLLNVVKQFSLQEIIFILARSQRILWNNTDLYIHSFRPDNVYVKYDDDDIMKPMPRPRCYADIPADEDLPLLLCNCRPAESFYIHPEMKERYSEVNLVYKFGWFVWILLEGTGSPPQPSENMADRFIQMKRGRFGNEVKKFEYILEACWTVNDKNVYRVKNEINTELNLLINQTK